MVNTIPNEIMFKILEFSENRNMKYIDKNFYKYIFNLRKNFIEKLKTKPIEIKYKLTRWKKKVYNNIQYRPSMYVENEQKYLIYDNKINIGKLTDKNINFTKEFEDKIVPTSYIKENSTYNEFVGYVTYWTVKDVYTDDTELYQYYYLLN